VTFADYIDEVNATAPDRSELRIGQVAFLVLASCRPELADAVRRQSDLDPRVVHDNLARFFKFVRANWEPLPTGTP